tara:strand:+ start:59 stop:475 length:417 start_codon:yes stop_codon:yes gene_type:complete
MAAGEPSQITDIGAGAGKGELEEIAAAGDISLGMKGDTVSPGPARIAPKPQGSLNLGGISDYVANAPNQGGIASDKLPFGQGLGPDAPVLTEQEQVRRNAIDNALDIYANTKIPAVRAAAAQVIQGAVISQLQGDEDG